MWKALRETLDNLRECPRELWLIFVVKALESYSYFSMSLIYVVYLTDTFGVLWGVILGPAVDMLGIRVCLVICFVAECACRAVMAATTSLPLLYLLLYTVLPMSGALGVPVMTIAVKRYTTEKARSMAFGLFYTVMNVAALINGFAVDALRRWLCHGISLPGVSLSDGNRVVVASGAVSAAIALIVTLYLSPAVEQQALVRVGGVGGGLREVNPIDEGAETTGLVAAEPSSQHGPGAYSTPPESSIRAWPAGRRVSGSWLMRAVMSTGNALTAVHNNTVELLAYPGMWRYLVMALFLLNLRQTYRCMDSMLPKYMQRTMGCSAPYGSTYSINPAIIIALVPVVSLATSHVPHFDMVHYGSYVSASSPFWIYLVRSPAVLGPVLFVVQLSLGESVWSPRWYDYTMDVAPEGREGLFGAIAAAPLFLAKLPTGLLSGFLLNSYCPAQDGGCNAASGHVCPSNGDLQVAAAAPSMVRRALVAEGAAVDIIDSDVSAGTCDPWLWAIVGFVTMTTPLLITTFHSCLRPTRNEACSERRAQDAAVGGMQLMHPQSNDPQRFNGGIGLGPVLEGSQELTLSAGGLLEHADRQHASSSLPPM